MHVVPMRPLGSPGIDVLEVRDPLARWGERPHAADSSLAFVALNTIKLKFKSLVQIIQ